MSMNLPFPRPAEPPIKPQYIVLFKGDDSDFQDNQSVDIVIDTELDTTGMKAHFRFMDFVQDFDSIPENKTLSLVFPNAKTSEFPLGAADATLRFEDASGKFRTVSNRIHIVVTNSVHEAYNNEDSQSITVTVKGTVTWNMIEGKPTFAPVATSGSYNDLTDKPEIPAPITVDPALSQTSGNPVQNKVVTKALYTGFTEWETVKIPEGFTFVSANYLFDIWYVYFLDPEGHKDSFTIAGEEDALTLTDETYFGSGEFKIARHLITPTKTSQLTNDGPSSGPNVGHPFATTNQIPAPVDISGKLDGAAAYPAWEASPQPAYSVGKVVSYHGRLYRLDNTDYYNPNLPPEEDFEAWTEVRLEDLKQDALSSAQLANIAAVPQKANASDLPYAMVTLTTPTEWVFSDGRQYDVYVEGEGSSWYLTVSFDGISTSVGSYSTEDEANSVLSFSFNTSSLGLDDEDVTATRATLPGHLCDRAGNRVVVSGDTTLTLPALVNAGKLRDFLVRLEISGSTVPTITFQGQGSEAPNGADEITYETDGDEFPVPDEVGNWVYSFTENCAAHKFAVSLKKINAVTQGGS